MKRFTVTTDFGFGQGITVTGKNLEQLLRVIPKDVKFVPPKVQYTFENDKKKKEKEE